MISSRRDFTPLLGWTIFNNYSNMQITLFAAAFGSLLFSQVSKAAVLDARSTACIADNCMELIKQPQSVLD
jgi:hypothetical protein